MTTAVLPWREKSSKMEDMVCEDRIYGVPLKGCKLAVSSVSPC
jgi:hypothetical protein